MLGIQTISLSLSSLCVCVCLSAFACNQFGTVVLILYRCTICRFLNKGLSDFNLALDLGFLTKARKYTFFKPKFIFYATYLSEKIGYWRYITIYRHLKTNPQYQCYPIFKYFENWCQDENRHGDFFSALMKAQPQFLNDWKAKLWARFFCLSVLFHLETYNSFNSWFFWYVFYGYFVTN